MDEEKTFLEAAERLLEESGSDGFLSEIGKEPWPAWFLNVVMRMTRVLAPDLTRKDLKERPAHFYGHIAAFELRLLKEAQKLDLSQLPEMPLSKAVKSEIDYLKIEENKRLRATMEAAYDLPLDQAITFGRAWSSGMEKNTVNYALQRLEDNHTAQICFFLLFMRPMIEGKKFESITALFKLFIQIQELDEDRKEFFAQNSNAQKSLEKQFRKICSEDKLKLRGKGKPGKNTPNI